MSSDFDNELVKTAIIHFKAREFDLARRYLERALDVADDYDTIAKACWYMSQLTEDVAKKRKFLEDTLAYDRANALAKRELAILDGRLKREDIINPDLLAPQVEGGVRAANADRFMCPKCGARMAFAPDGHSLYCEHCSRNQTLALGTDNDENDRDFVVAMATEQGHRKPVAMHSFNCKGCGASFILPPQVISATCSYCGSPHVVNMDETTELIEPDGILPFAFEQKQAVNYIVAWGKKKNIRPDGRVPAPRGVYLPVWTFDVGGDIPYTAQIVAEDDSRNYRKRVVRDVNDIHPVIFGNFPVAATKKFGKLLESALTSFNFDSVAGYDPRYLASWPAEVYEIPMGDASLTARSKIFERSKEQIRLRLDMEGYVENLRQNSANITVDSFQLVLVPLWMTTYKAGGQIFTILVNGQTGSVHGEYPQTTVMGWLENLLK